MTDAEISRRLALAIGWDRAVASMVHDHALVPSDPNGNFRPFDYRDPAVIWPIAERFDCFPSKVSSNDAWDTFIPNISADISGVVQSDTAAKAVALAVIKAKEQT